MDEQIVSEIAATLKELRNEGQYGIIIVICSLGLLLALAVWIIWVQRETLKKTKIISDSNQAQIDSTNTRVSAVDLAIKELREARAERNDVQEQIRTFFKDQIDTMHTVNQELRSEFGRIESKQDQFESNIKEAINIGLQDVKQKLDSVSAKEFIDQIPKEFRSGLESELASSSEGIITEFIQKISESTISVNEKAIGGIVERIISRELNEHLSYFRRELRDEMLSIINQYSINQEKYLDDRGPKRIVSHNEYVRDIAREIAFYLSRS